ncbi:MULTISPECIES: hypothetical protein [Pseudomonas]|jgi:hypothetical protein|uniref:hypothetical protein n=1 Tax=Pseudomonas TaxID=286 RepID=UPI000BA31DD8|nr:MULTISPECIES: hypothetical protein [Pseudomonas]NNA59276.1 hypothetical protein [Pseudomonas koreensis]
MANFSAILDELINVSIQKAFSGITRHDYTVNKSDLGRQRKTDQLIDDCTALCEGRDIECSYNEREGAFHIHIDLNRCRLNLSQASAYSAAMASSYVG